MNQKGYTHLNYENTGSFRDFYQEISYDQFLPIAEVSNWFMAPEVYREAKSLYGEMEGQHATPSEIALTLHLEPSLKNKQYALPSPAPAGPIYDYEDFRRRYPDGRMGSDPFLAKASHGKTLLNKAANALSQELIDFLKQK